jgi:hypothetical protein
LEGDAESSGANDLEVRAWKEEDFSLSVPHQSGYIDCCAQEKAVASSGEAWSLHMLMP